MEVRNRGRDQVFVPTVAEETIFIGDGGGQIYGLGTETGDDTWTFDTDWGVESSPMVVDGVLFVGAGDGTVFALVVPAEGHSIDSRMKGGVLNHHRSLFDSPDQSIELDESNRGDVATKSDDEVSDPETDSGDVADSNTAEELPGFGIVVKSLISAEQHTY